MLHPVGPLPARVYWRRRLLVLVALVAVLTGGGWGTVALLDRPGAASFADAAAVSPVPTPALELVLPSLTSVRTPGSRPTAARTTAARPSSAPASTAAPVAGGPCTDRMVRLTVDAPTSVRAGSSPTLTLVVRNVSRVPCVRRLDAELQEIELFDDAGTRVWGSNDCKPEKSDRTATLRPGQTVSFDVVWSGLSSTERCAGPRRVLDAGVYVLRGRLDTKASGERRMRITQL